MGRYPNQENIEADGIPETLYHLNEFSQPHSKYSGVGLIEFWSIPQFTQ